jgi:mono/diheme cytochrome c family protein
MIRRLMFVVAVAALPVVALAGDARRDAILADYAGRARAVDPAAIAFSAQRGETLFRTKWTGGDPRTSSCTACHTADPRKAGQNAKTGRPIEPVAVSANPRRFTDPATVEKQFTRDCRNVLGRECTPLEKGDYITFMAGQ